MCQQSTQTVAESSNAGKADIVQKVPCARAVKPHTVLMPVLEGLGQGLMGMLMFPLALEMWAYVTSLYFASVQMHYGLELAVFAVSSLSMLTHLLIAIVLTIPALIGQKRGKIQEHKQTSVQEVKQLMPLVALNFCISVVVLAGASLALTPRDRLMNLTAGLPSWYTLYPQALVFFFIADVWSFFVHRLLHKGMLYELVHKLHHHWTAPVALEATYAHPVEFVLMQLGAGMLGPIAWVALSGEGLHAAVMLCWTMTGFIHGAGGHSGYWGTDFGLHDLHHERFVYNFSASGLPDLLFGTSRVRSSAPSEKTL